MLTPEQKKSVLRPGTIWRRRKNGAWERVYIESLESRLIANSSSAIDIRTEFGCEHIPKKKFLESFEFCGWAKIRLNEIASEKNLIPTLGDPRIWMKQNQGG